MRSPNGPLADRLHQQSDATHRQVRPELVVGREQRDGPGQQTRRGGHVAANQRRQPGAAQSLAGPTGQRSSSVVHRPTLSRTAPRPTSGGTRIAQSTGD